MRKSRLFFGIILWILVALIVVGCVEPAPTPAPEPTPIPAPAPVTTPTSIEMIRSEKQRVTSPDVSVAALVTLVNGNSAFAFDLYQALIGADGNLFSSPYSISLALVMILPPLPSLTPFELICPVRQAFKAFSFRIQFLRCFLFLQLHY
jgi:hypothetical protein